MIPKEPGPRARFLFIFVQTATRRRGRPHLTNKEKYDTMEITENIPK